MRVVIPRGSSLAGQIIREFEEGLSKIVVRREAGDQRVDLSEHLSRSAVLSFEGLLDSSLKFAKELA
jgi:hypothetical protein